MIFTVKFSSPTFADLALGELKQQTNIKNVRYSPFETDDTLPVNYPVKPHLYEKTPNQFYDGFPHITSDTRVSLVDEGNKEETALKFSVDSSYKTVVESILYKFGGLSIDIRH